VRARAEACGFQREGERRDRNQFDWHMRISFEHSRSAHWMHRRALLCVGSHGCAHRTTAQALFASRRLARAGEREAAHAQAHDTSPRGQRPVQFATSRHDSVPDGPTPWQTSRSTHAAAALQSVPAAARHALSDGDALQCAAQSGATATPHELTT
jgi:hypothetical protein